MFSMEAKLLMSALVRQLSSCSSIPESEDTEEIL